MVRQNHLRCPPWKPFGKGQALGLYEPSVYHCLSQAYEPHDLVGERETVCKSNPDQSQSVEV